MTQIKWWKLQKGTGIRVKIIGDIDVLGKQKYRPSIVIKSYPSHVKVQLMTTEKSNHDFYTTTIDKQTQYIRPIYFRTIKFNEITDIWKDRFDIPIQLDRKSNLFIKIAEMEYKEITSQNLDLEKISKLEKENKQLRKKINY